MIKVDIKPVALHGLWRHPSTPQDDMPTAPPRTHVYQFETREIGGEVHVVPVKFSVQGAGKQPLIEMAFESPALFELGEASLQDPASTLQIDDGTATTAYYQVLKDYYRYLQADRATRQSRVLELLTTRMRSVRDAAVSEGQYDIAMELQKRICSTVPVAGEDNARWMEEVNRFIDMAHSHPERELAWKAQSTAVQLAYRHGTPEFVRHVEERYIQLIVERFETGEALGRGLDYGFVYGLPCFLAVEAKSRERQYLVPAALGKAKSLAFLARHLRVESTSWEQEDCRAYLDEANEALRWAEAAMGPGDPDYWQHLAEGARREIREAEGKLDVGPETENGPR